MDAEEFANALDRVPRLTSAGLGAGWTPNESHADGARRFEEYRDDLRRHGRDGFCRAYTWLLNMPRRRTINRQITSYGLKHLAETEIGYVTNGEFIAAAVAHGFDWKPDGDSPNAFFNISLKGFFSTSLKAI